MVDASADRIVVVVVDDSARRALARLLRSRGFEVTTFGSAAELLAADVPGDAVLVVDVRVPAFDGVALCERLRAAGRDLPTVFVTAHGRKGPGSPALRGAPILQKPVDAGSLVDAIAVARGRSLRRATR